MLYIVDAASNGIPHNLLNEAMLSKINPQGRNAQ